MAEYTEFDTRETEAYGARIEAEQAFRDHQQLPQADDDGELLSALTAEWFAQDKRLGEAARATYAAWQAALAANPRHQQR